MISILDQSLPQVKSVPLAGDGYDVTSAPLSAVAIFGSCVTESTRQVSSSITSALDEKLQSAIKEAQIPETSAKRLQAIIPCMLQQIRDLEQQGSLVIAQQWADRCEKLITFNNRTANAPLQLELLEQGAYEFFVEQILTGEVFTKRDSVCPGVQTNGSISKVFQDYLSNHYNSFLLRVQSSPFELSAWLDALTPLNNYFNSNRGNQLLIFDLFGSPDFNPAFFQPENHASLNLCAEVLSPVYRNLRQYFGLDASLAVRHMAGAVYEALEKSNNFPDMRKALQDIVREFSSLISNSRDLQAKGVKLSFVTGVMPTDGVAVVRQGEIVLQAVTLPNVKPFATYSASNCIILKVGLLKDGQLDTLALAHVDPCCTSTSLKQTFAALQLMGQLDVSLYGGSLYNVVRLRRDLLELGIEPQVFLRPAYNPLTAGPASYSALLLADGEILIFRDENSTLDTVRLEGDDWERSWSLDKTLRWRVEG